MTSIFGEANFAYTSQHPSSVGKPKEREHPSLKMDNEEWQSSATRRLHRDGFNPVVFNTPSPNDPAVSISLPEGKNAEVAGETVDYVEILRVALRNRTCAVCGTDLHHRQTPRSGFCSKAHYYKWRDARRYAEDPEGQRERGRAYYWANREKVLEKAAARRGRSRPPELTECQECGDPLTGRQRVICGTARCRERRFKRLQPEAYAERERQKVERRREKRRAARAQRAGT